MMFELSGGCSEFVAVDVNRHSKHLINLSVELAELDIFLAVWKVGFMVRAGIAEGQRVAD